MWSKLLSKLTGFPKPVLFVAEFYLRCDSVRSSALPIQEVRSSCTSCKRLTGKVQNGQIPGGLTVKIIKTVLCTCGWCRATKSTNTCVVCVICGVQQLIIWQRGVIKSIKCILFHLMRPVELFHVQNFINTAGAKLNLL